MTKQEKAKLAEAVQLLTCDDIDRWHDAMAILCRMLNPEWRHPEPPSPTTIQELMQAHEGEDGG